MMREEYKKHVQTKVDINHAHELLEHASMDTTKLTAATLGWDLVGEQKPCAHCSLGKIKKLKLLKVAEKKQAEKMEICTLE